MKYNKWSMKRIKEGKKTLTSRRTSHEYDPEVNDVVGPLPWYFIRDYLFRDEGAESPEELQGIINQVQRRIVDDDTLFFVHVISPKAVLHYYGKKEK